MTLRPFDLTRDCRWVLEKQWLKDGEQLIAYSAVEEGQTLVEIPGHYRDGRPHGNPLWRLVKGVGWAVVYALFFWLIAESYSGSSIDRAAPPAIVWGDSATPRVLPRNLPTITRGIWVMTDSRVALLQVDDVADGIETVSDNGVKPAPVRLTPVLEVRDFTYRGQIERSRHTRFTKRLRWTEEFHRADCSDGSGVDMLVRRPPKSHYGDN